MTDAMNLSQENQVVVQIAEIRQVMHSQRSALESVQVDLRKVTDAMPALHLMVDAHARNDQIIKELLVKTTENDSKLGRLFAVFGVVGTMGALLAGLAWTQLQSSQLRETNERLRIEAQLNPQIQSQDERIRKLEIHSAGDPDRPFTR